MKRCEKCVLPETFPGIDFDEVGICNFCRSFKGRNILENSITKYHLRFNELLETSSKIGSYDCLMAFSGGKDSTYTLVLLKEQYNLSILALTMDNGFISPHTQDNIYRVIEKLGVDHIMYKPSFDLLKSIFQKAVNSVMYSKKTLTRASTICTSCMGIVKFLTLRLAIESDIPFIIYGWSPGQIPIEASIFKNNPTMIRSMQKVLLEPMREAAGPDIENYFLREQHFSHKEKFPYNISPLAFLNYDEKKVIDTITKYGWRRPNDTDPNSTNCLLNAFAIKVHKDRFQFNPYVFELSKLVREGYMDRSEAIQRLETEEDQEIIQRVLSRLEIK